MRIKTAVLRISFKSRRLIVIAAVAVLSLGAAAWLVYPYLSFNEMFRRSKSALDAYARQVAANGKDLLKTPPHSLGYFHILGAEPLTHGFVLQSDYGNPFDWDGLAYSTTKLPNEETDSKGNVTQVFEPIKGNWYTVFRP